jgi:hypothetical protein
MNGLDGIFKVLYLITGIGIAFVMCNVIILVMYLMKRRKEWARILRISSLFLFLTGFSLLFTGDRMIHLAGLLLFALGFLNVIVPLIRKPG